MKKESEAFRGRILVVEDNESLRAGIKLCLEDEGHELFECPSGLLALDLLSTTPYDLVITDLKLGDISGVEVLKKAKEINSEVEVIVITAYATPDTAIQALRYGAFDYIQKPFEMYELLQRVMNALSVKKFRDEATYFRNLLVKKGDDDSIVSTSPGMKKVMRIARKVAPAKATVLISGETGTGKERLATYIHKNSPRSEKRIIKVNCAALHENLLESELFGHEKGAFTGAEKTRIGKFEAADRGTIFLDEIGDMSPAIQAKVLRVLQEEEFERLGSNKNIKVNVRVIAATNRNLTNEVEEGNFRQDLYYRLNIINIPIPPLREREKDITILARQFLDRFTLEFARKVSGFSHGAVSRLVQYRWPGNVRELQNVVERAVLLCEGDLINEEDIMIGDETGKIETPASSSGYDLKDFEREKVIDALRRSGFVQKKAAKILGVSPRVLNYKIKIHEIDWKGLKKEGD